MCLTSTQQRICTKPISQERKLYKKQVSVRLRQSKTRAKACRGRATKSKGRQATGPNKSEGVRGKQGLRPNRGEDVGYHQKSIHVQTDKNLSTQGPSAIRRTNSNPQRVSWPKTTLFLIVSDNVAACVVRSTLAFVARAVQTSRIPFATCCMPQPASSGHFATYDIYISTRQTLS